MDKIDLLNKISNLNNPPPKRLKNGQLLVLGSQSRDRVGILKLLKIPFIQIISEFEERINQNLSPEQTVIDLAQGKLKSIINKINGFEKGYENYIIITADTIVSYRGKIIGKAKDKEHAFSILKELSGQTHELITGVCVYDSESQNTQKFVSKTKVKFLKLSDEDIWNYLNNSDEYKGRAGAYSLRERASCFIESIEGSPSNVIGLPISDIYKALKNIGINILEEQEFKGILSF
ncbi:MAG: Maf family protein [Promethearchaeota archaeon]